MTEELKQALRTIEHLRASPLMANHRAGLDAAHQLLFPLSQRPAAQTEREAFENWLGIKPCGAAHDLAWDAWKARASLPATQQATPDQFADASKMVAPVALRSVRLTRDTAGMCIVRINGRVAIRDNGDLIDHTATLEWFADTQQATPEPVGEPDTVPLDALHAAERERDYWKTRARAMLDHAEGTCWYWMGDGEDHLESLVNSLPVVIRADQLRELLARPAPGVPEGEPKLTQEELLEVAKYAWLKARTADSLQFYRTLLAAAQAKGGGHA